MVSIPILGDVIREVGATVRELIPDADKRLEIDLQLAELADKADARESELLQGQIEVNKVEAASSNLFVAGWRPFIGWTSGVTLGYTWILAPLLQWTLSLFGIVSQLPALSPETIYPIVLAMLGVSASRTVEKMNGVATSMGGVVLKNQTSVNTPTTVAEEKKLTKPSSWFR